MTLDLATRLSAAAMALFAVITSFHATLAAPGVLA
jgi:hypothetical protein